MWRYSGLFLPESEQELFRENFPEELAEAQRQREREERREQAKKEREKEQRLQNGENRKQEKPVCDVSELHFAILTIPKLQKVKFAKKELQLPVSGSSKGKGKIPMIIMVGSLSQPPRQQHDSSLFSE